MTKEELAKILDGSEYPLHIDEDVLNKAKESKLVIVSGSGDDNCSFDGAIYDEFGCYNGGEGMIDKDGIMYSWNENETYTEREAELYFERKKNAKLIQARWCEEEPYTWTYGFNIPHITFDIMNDGEKWCRGMVFSLDDLGEK